MKSDVLFHLAIPARDIPATIEFYRDKLLLQLGRYTDEWAIFNFSGTQLVVHKSNDIADKATMYPRHFGLVLRHKDIFDGTHARAFLAGVPFLAAKFSRFMGTPAEHETFCIIDPSNNVIEFKWYRNEGAIFGTNI